MRLVILAAALLATALPAAAGLLSGQGVAVVDATGAQRASFSSNETIGFSVAIFNGAVSANRISFQVSVVAPNGNVVFRHVGNSVRGTVGTAASAITGIAISRFAQGPGAYTLKATATLDGVAVEQDQTFVISSPNLLLIYPPNGAVNLTDNPLTFQWYSSGAATYRVTVGDNPSLYNAYFVQTTAPGASSLTYPQNPSDNRQRLSTGQIYYWNVAGLDGNGNVVAQSQVPFSFSVANTALTRDLAVTAFTIEGAADASGNIPFVVTVANQGNTTETNTPLRVTVGGLTAPGSPITIPQMSPADVKTFNVFAPIPTGMTQAIAIACLTLFDDNVANNCKTLTVNAPPPISSGTLASITAEMSAPQIWQAIQNILKDQGMDLSEYNLVNMEGSMTQAQLAALLDQLRQGLVQTSLSGPPLSTLNPPSASTAAPAGMDAGAPPPPPTAPGPDASAPPAPETLAPPPVVSTGAYEPPTIAQEQTWSGVATPLAPQTVSVAVKKAVIWERLWKRLSSEPVPVVDFSQHMVVAIMAGAQDRGDRIEIDDYKTEGDTLNVRYRIISYARPFAAEGDQKDAPKKTTQYLLTVIPRSVLKVKFEKGD